MTVEASDALLWKTSVISAKSFIYLPFIVQSCVQIYIFQSWAVFSLCLVQSFFIWILGVIFLTNRFQVIGHLAFGRYYDWLSLPAQGQEIFTEDLLSAKQKARHSRYIVKWENIHERILSR